MSLKLNFKSEKELVEYLKKHLVIEHDIGYYGDGYITVKLESHDIASKYSPGDGCHCSDG